MTEYTLEQSKSHPDFPFLDFAENPPSFLMLELYWSQLFTELIKNEGENWSPIIDAEMDGNPIFCVMSILHMRQLRVIHKVNDENKPSYPIRIGEGTYYGLQAWLNESIMPDGNTPLNELVLFSDLSLDAEKEALNLIRLHCIDLIDKGTMEKEIIKYETRVGMPD